jgi:hypothetical protein
MSIVFFFEKSRREIRDYYANVTSRVQMHAIDDTIEIHNEIMLTEVLLHCLHIAHVAIKKQTSAENK